MNGRAGRGLVFVVAGLAPALAWAAPAEPPPADYAGRSFVDSRGCAFQRAVLSGTVLWVARETAEGVAVCGKEPTFATTPLAEPLPAPAPKKAASPVSQGAERGRWIQIGAFADPANADRALARLQSLGLPRATLAVKGGRLKAVLAGPFETPEAFDQARKALKDAGFRAVLARP